MAYKVAKPEATGTQSILDNVQSRAVLSLRRAKRRSANKRAATLKETPQTSSVPKGEDAPKQPEKTISNPASMATSPAAGLPAHSIHEAEESTLEQPGSPPLSPYTTERQRIRELTMPTVPNFDIPDSPPPPPMNSEEAADLTARTRKFERFLEMKKQGVHFNERLQSSTALRNPSLLPKLMEFAGVSQRESYMSTLPEELAVPVKWPLGTYVENLMEENERREKKRLKEKDRVDFVKGPKEEGIETAGGLKDGDAGPPKKKSRLDQ